MMWKKIVAGVLAAIVIGVAGYKLFFAKSDVDAQLDEVLQTMTGYHLEGNMELTSGEESRTFQVKVSYQKEEEEDLFRVSLFDTSINQEQLILRNENGVYVLTPTLNQVHQFKGEWPMNSPKPYLYQSMLDVFGKDHTVDKIEGGLVVTSYPDFPNAKQWDKQVIKFTKDLKPVLLQIYSPDNELRVKLTVTAFDFNPPFADTYFQVDANMEQAREELGHITATLEDLPLLPVGVDLSVTLKEQTTTSINGSVVYILSYEGSKPFTIVQKLLEESDEIVNGTAEGELVDLMSGFGYIKPNSITYTYNGVMTQIYSEVLTKAELIEVANGIEVVTTK